MEKKNIIFIILYCLIMIIQIVKSNDNLQNNNHNNDNINDDDENEQNWNNFEDHNQNQLNLTNIEQEETTQKIKQIARLSGGTVVIRRLKTKIYMVIKEVQAGNNKEKILYTYNICKDQTGKNCLSTYEWMKIILDAKQISPKTKFSNDCFKTTIFLDLDYTFVITPNFQTNDFDIVPFIINGPFKKKSYLIHQVYYLIDKQYTVRQRVVNLGIVEFCTSSSIIYL